LESLLYLAIRIYRLNDATCEALLRGRLLEKQRRAVALIWAATQDDIPSTTKPCFSPLTLSLHEQHAGLESGATSDSYTPSSEIYDSLLSDRREREKLFLSEYEDTIAASSDYEDLELSDNDEVDISDAESSAADKRGLVSLRVGKATSRSTYREYIDIVEPHKPSGLCVQMKYLRAPYCRGRDIGGCCRPDVAVPLPGTICGW
jgi:hypothetical protein